MILLNFSHPISDAQQAQIEILAGRPIEHTIAAMPHFNEEKPFIPQVQELLAQVQLTPAEWQGEPILVILPSLNFIAAVVLAELHGRMGFFPPVVRIRPIAGSIPRQFEIAEILDLQTVRERARGQRQKG